VKLPLAAVVLVVVALGCGDDSSDEPAASRDRRGEAPAAPAPPPDAGTQTGHGADRGRVAVPARDDSPPEAAITLHGAGRKPLARTSQPPPPDRPPVVELDQPRLRGTAVGRDPDGGVARVRLSIKEEIACRNGDRQLRTRYFPPSQIERIRSNPGARLPTRVTRTLALTLSGDRCDPAEPVAVHGELWGEAINGNGLEAVTPHLRFRWRRIALDPSQRTASGL
jgi:hypothetical protein